MKLTKDGCRARQQRLLAVIQDKGLDGAVISRRETVYYLSGYLHNPFHAAAMFVRADGHTVLAAAEDASDTAAVDENIAYEPEFLSTMHSRQHEAVTDALEPAVPAGRYGADIGDGHTVTTALAGDDPVDLTPDILRMRKCKASDEVAAMRESIHLTDVMYATAKAIICDGADEVDVFSQIQAAAVREAGEFLEAFGNDFQANAIGGLARRRQMHTGEIYILDSGPLLHGYHADNCRSFVVGGDPSDEQMKVWQRIDALFPLMEAAIKPGTPAVNIFNIGDEYLRWEGYDGMIHHMGHGVGLTPHEAPELNPNYDAVLEVGDIFTMEPGLYSSELRAGMRIEENYLITEDGFEKLTTFPRDLA